MQRVAPKVITIVSFPQVHKVFYGGSLQFTGSTEVDCARFLQKTVPHWPERYSDHSSYGTLLGCTSTFSQGD